MFIKIYFFFLLANILLAVVDNYATDIGQTTSSSSITSVGSGFGIGDMPNFFNNTDATNTLLPNFTDTKNATIVGHTGDGNFYDPIVQPVERLYQVGEMSFEIITGNFIVNTMNAVTSSIGITFPTAWTFGFQVLVGFVNIFFIIYIVLGRAIPTFN